MRAPPVRLDRVGWPAGSIGVTRRPHLNQRGSRPVPVGPEALTAPQTRGSGAPQGAKTATYSLPGSPASQEELPSRRSS